MKSSASTAIAAVVLIGTAAAMLFPRFAASPEARREAELKQALAVIGYALLKYSQEHAGEYPPGEKIKGGEGKDDVLLHKGYIARYPPNPLRQDGAPVENTAGRNFSPGDFVYIRKKNQPYEYTLFAWGAGGGRKVMR